MALEQPKKPVGGAYGIFLAEKRPEFAKACEGKPASAISKMAGEAWKNLSETDKKPHQEKYEQAKAKYEKDMAAFIAAGGEKAKGAAALRSEKKHATTEKKTKDPNRPKKPAGGAYGVYVSENRASIVASLPAGHRVTDVSKAAGVQFKALSEEAKKPYHDMFLKRQEEYKKAMEEYKVANPEAAEEEDEQDAVVEAEGEAKTIATKASPKKRAASDGSSPQSAKRGRQTKVSSPAAPDISADLLKVAMSEGLDVQFRNLLSRPDVQASGQSQAQMLEALKIAGGLVNKAKAAILGA